MLYDVHSAVIGEPGGGAWVGSSGAERRGQGYVVQVERRTVGIVVRHGRDYRFYATDPAFSGLDGQHFRRARHAEHAAARFAATRRERGGIRP